MNIFPLFYFPPISYWAFLINAKEIEFELFQNYRKQKYWNRCMVLTSNKVLGLSIPVVKQSQNTPLKAIKIRNVEEWQHDHFRALECAYRSSPYFEYYESYFQAFYDQRFETLVDLNQAAFDLIVRLLEIEVKFGNSEKYQDSSAYTNDYRESFDAKTRSHPNRYNPVSYDQVFGEKFEEDLSILDLLFNEGPSARPMLMGALQNQEP